MILTRLAYGVNVTFEEVVKTGISGVTTAHIEEWLLRMGMR